MEFRRSNKSEFMTVRQLWSQCFGDEEPWTSWYFSRHYRADRTWVGLQDGRVAAQAHLLPHRLMLRGAWRDAAYFVGVCVEESLRGTGIGRDLMRTALCELRRTRVGISILQPRWPEFYKKLGWDYCYSRQGFHFPLETVAGQLLSGPLPEWAEGIPDIPALAGLYEAFVKPRHGFARRGRRDWEVLLADHCGDGGRVAIISTGAGPSGYVLYNIRGGLLRVREMVWRDGADVDGIWRMLLAQARSMEADTLEWDDPSGDPVSSLYSRSVSRPFLMGRLTDIRPVLSGIAYPPDMKATIGLTVTDPLLPWNHGSFIWSISQGKAGLSPVSDPGESGLTLGIGTLSRLFFGEESAERVLAAADVRCQDAQLAILDRIFPGCRNYISEYF